MKTLLTSPLPDTLFPYVVNSTKTQEKRIQETLSDLITGVDLCSSMPETERLYKINLAGENIISFNNFELCHGSTSMQDYAMMNIRA